MTSVQYFNAIDAEIAPASSDALVACAYDGTACSVSFFLDSITGGCDDVNVFVESDADNLMQYKVDSHVSDVFNNSASGYAVSNRVVQHTNKIINVTVGFSGNDSGRVARAINDFVSQLSKPIDTLRVGHLYLFFSCRLSDVDYSYNRQRTYCKVNLTFASNYPFCFDGRYNTTVNPSEWGMLLQRAEDGTFTPPSWYSIPVFLFDSTEWTKQILLEQFVGNYVGERQNSSTYYAKVPIGLQVFSSVLFPLSVPGSVESGSPIILPSNEVFKPSLRVYGLAGGNLGATIVAYRIYF